MAANTYDFTLTFKKYVEDEIQLDGSPTEKDVVKGTTEYEGTVIPTLFRKWNTVGCQFHPEKSSTSGMQFLRNFIRFAEDC